MSGTRTRTVAIGAVAAIALLVGGGNLAAEPGDPSQEELADLVEGYAQAIETNNRELALWYVHPRSPWRSEADAALRDQLASYFEGARTSSAYAVPSATSRR